MPKVLFHHLAKTAGTSLLESLEKYYGSRMCQARYDHELTEEVIESDLFEFYHGHFSFNIVRKFRERNPDSFIFTIVRNPINRVLSQYFNWIDKARVMRELDVVMQRSGDNELFKARRKKFEDLIFSMSLDQFLNSKDADVREVTFNHQSGYMSDDTVQDHDERLSQAVDSVLSFYNFVGLMELYDPCLEILEKKIGLPSGTCMAVGKKNVTQFSKSEGKYRVTVEQNNLLKISNFHDISAYSAAYTRLRKEYNNFIPEKYSSFSSILNSPQII